MPLYHALPGAGSGAPAGTFNMMPHFNVSGLRVRVWVVYVSAGAHGG